MIQRNFDSVRNKIISVASANGLSELVTNQPTDWAIYDMIDLSTSGSATANQVSFFNNVNSKTFPQTNLSSNTLTGGQCLGVYGVVFSIHTVTSGKFNKPVVLEQAIGYEQLEMLDFSLVISGQQVLQNVSGLKGMSGTNPNGNWGAVAAVTTTITNTGNNVIDLDSVPVILPNQLFQINATLPQYTVPAAGAAYLRCTLFGYGTIAAIANMKR